LLRKNADLGMLHNTLRTIPDNATPTEEIEAVLEFAVDLYDKLSTAQLWIRPGKGGGGTALNTITQRVVECWNCGEKGHPAQQCPHPKNPELYNKNRKAFMDKKSGNNSRNGGSNPSGSNAGKGNETPGYDRKAWEAKLTKQNIKVDTDGVLKCFCKKCGFNTTHSTGFHKVYILNPAVFTLHDNHPYKVACAQLRGQHFTPTPKPPFTQMPSGEKTTGGHGGSLNLSRAQVEQKLADLERTSTDPNAASIAETIRAIFLN
jgi:hypothetical protein